MTVPVWSVGWAALHLMVAGVMATIAYFDFRLWWKFRDQGALKITGLLCSSVGLTLTTGAVGLAFPVPEVFRAVIPVRSLLIGVTVALFLQALNSMVKLPGLRLAAVVSIALPLVYGALGLTTDLAYMFPSPSPWPQIRPVGNILAALGLAILGAYTVRAVMMLKAERRHQLGIASASVVALLAIGIGAGPGMISEATTTLWTLPIAVLLARWWGTRVLTTHGSLRSAVAGLLEAERVADHWARHDQITGLPNRIVAADTLAHLLDGVDSGSAIVVSTVRLSRLDELRSTEGTPSVDHFLRVVAEHLQYGREVESVVARLGEGTFVVFTTITQESADRLSGQLIVEQAVRHMRRTANFPAQIGVAVGIATSDGRSSAAELLQKAEMAVNAAEHSKLLVEFYRPELRDEVIKRARTGSLLRSAIDNNEFEVHYQPVVDTGSLRRIGVEGLVRWRHQGILHQPLEWIPLAEQQGLMREIGLIVLRTAVRDYPRLQCPIAVNVSPSQFTDGHFVEEVLEVLRDVPAGAILLEITEGTITSNQRQARIALDVLRSHGIRIALDDFGTEYSSLSRLVSLPFDVLKIDRSFIANILTPQGNAIATAIQAMAHAIGKSTVAEGVETEEQLRAVQRIGFDRIQGFYTGRPETLSDLLASASDPATVTVIVDEQSGGINS